MDVIIGTAPDSWGVWHAQDARQTPWTRYLDEAAEAGYAWSELGPYGYMPTQAPRLTDELARRGLKITASAVVADLTDFAARPALERQAEDICALLAALNGRYLVLIDDIYSDLETGRQKHAPELDAAGWSRLLETTDRLARIARRAGLTLVFHPHAQTRIETEAQIEHLLERTDPSLVGLCLDTGHHAYLGQDAVAFFRTHHRRIPYLHVKSVDAALRARVAAERLPFGEAVARGVFCEPAQGTVDFVALRDALREVAWRGYAIVEQDMFPTAFDRPLPIARRTLEYLSRIGLGDSGRSERARAMRG